MKYLFLCGSLEPGRDGVGDYVRRLAEELLQRGHLAAGIALNDQYTEQEIFCAQPVQQCELPALRLPAIWPAKRRFQRARQWIDELQPVWISLQLVPYAFHSKGLPLLLGWYLRDLTRGRQIHLMIHDTWVGIEVNASLKRKLLIWLQKLIIRNILSELNPTVIHTHLPTYRARLKHLGWNALPLPLFSNIPVVLAPQIDESNVFRIGIFSQADSSGPFISYLANLVKYLAQHQRRCQVLLMGGVPAKMRALVSILEDSANLHGQVHYTGFLTASQLSAVIQTCHLGLTPVPQQGLGKSGSVAAFLAHGVPIAAPISLENEENYIGFFHKSIHAAVLTGSDLSQIQTAQAAAQLAKQILHISNIGSAFLSDLA